MSATIAHRASIFHLLDDPRSFPEAYQCIDDGLLVVRDGKVVAMGEASAELAKLPPGTEVIRHDDAVITPGFFDLHTHFPQLTTVAVYGEQLLGWLNAIIPE